MNPSCTSYCIHIMQTFWYGVVNTYRYLQLYHIHRVLTVFPRNKSCMRASVKSIIMLKRIIFHSMSDVAIHTKIYKDCQMICDYIHIHYTYTIHIPSLLLSLPLYTFCKGCWCIVILFGKKIGKNWNFFLIEETRYKREHSLSHK